MGSTLCLILLTRGDPDHPRIEKAGVTEKIRIAS